jgi:hypothetical protein
VILPASRGGGVAECTAWLSTANAQELLDRASTHVACAWLGNDEAATRKQYLGVTDAHFDCATGNPSQNTSHQPGQVEAKEAKSGASDQQKTPEDPHDCESAGV